MKRFAILSYLIDEYDISHVGLKLIIGVAGQCFELLTDKKIGDLRGDWESSFYFDYNLGVSYTSGNDCTPPTANSSVVCASWSLPFSSAITIYVWLPVHGYQQFPGTVFCSLIKKKHLRVLLQKYH
jgi:hypothetical protein